MQRLVGNAATQQWLDRQPAPESTVQRSVYLANADDRIYKSEDSTEELAYLLKYAVKYPVFIKYEAIDQLKADHDVTRIWREAGGVSEWFIGALVKVFDADRADAKRIKGYIGYPYLYANSKLEHSDLGSKGLAIVVEAAITGGAKIYQQGGGSRLPSSVGVVYTYKKTRDEVFEVLGIPRDRWPEYKNLQVKSKDDLGAYQKMLNAARQSPEVNFFEYSDSDSNTSLFYLSGVEVKRNANARIQVAGRRMADDVFFGIAADSTQETEMKKEFAKLGSPTADSGWVPGTSLNKKDREEGQAKAMNHWNALGAAAYANKFLGARYPIDQNWEWLHIRGAQIGGITDGTNLVPGLYVTNSFMIPYETMVMQWARADPKHFWARFTVSPGGTLFGRYISISIAAKGHTILGDFDPRELIKFDILAGKVVDKLANEMIKRNLDRSATFENEI